MYVESSHFSSSVSSLKFCRSSRKTIILSFNVGAEVEIGAEGDADATVAPEASFPFEEALRPGAPVEDPADEMAAPCEAVWPAYDVEAAKTERPMWKEEEGGNLSSTIGQSVTLTTIVCESSYWRLKCYISWRTVHIHSAFGPNIRQNAIQSNWLSCCAPRTTPLLDCARWNTLFWA